MTPQRIINFSFMEFVYYSYGSIFQKKNQNYLSARTAPIVIFTQGFATSGFLTEMHQSVILVPALQSHWLMMHVSMMVLGYAALLNLLIKEVNSSHKVVRILKVLIAWLVPLL
jgi:hypothetical protein